MDFEKVKELIALIEDTDVTEVEVESGGTRIKVVRGSQAAPMVVYGGVPAPAAQARGAKEGGAEDDGDEDSNLKPIPATMVGVFYRAASPDADPYVQVGQQVAKGETVCIIEAMKMMNEIQAEFDCRIVSVLLENGDPVQFGQPLFMVEPVLAAA